MYHENYQTKSKEAKSIAQQRMHKSNCNAEYIAIFIVVVVSLVFTTLDTREPGLR